MPPGLTYNAGQLEIAVISMLEIHLTVPHDLLQQNTEDLCSYDLKSPLQMWYIYWSECVTNSNISLVLQCIIIMQDSTIKLYFTRHQN